MSFYFGQHVCYKSEWLAKLPTPVICHPNGPSYGFETCVRTHLRTVCMRNGRRDPGYLPKCIVFRWDHTVKKGERFSRPQSGCHLPNSPWPGIISIPGVFPARESLVSDIPTGDGKNSSLFLQCMARPQCFLYFLSSIDSRI
jgi:hypothetical protein